MAATDPPPAAAAAWGSLVAAALALPGVTLAQTEPGPGPALIGFKWLSYRDRQPGLDRMRVDSPSWLLRLPLHERWGVEASLTRDSVSGASPRWHSAVSSASPMSDRRDAGDVTVTHYGPRHQWSLGLASSTENDFQSRAAALNGSINSDDNNRSWNLGVGLTLDRIGSSDDPALAGRRRTTEVTAGVAQALSRTDIVQLGLTHARGHGHYSDPYKRIDQRPGSRHQSTVLLRWNHHLEGPDITLRSSWRSTRDSFGVRSHTLSIEPVLPLGPGISLTPSLRLYTQTAARFYYDPVYSFAGAPYPPGYFDSPSRHLSPDHRLAAFGAVTVGVKLVLQLGQLWSTDLRLDRYEQRSRWHQGGPGSPGLAPLTAVFVQWGLSRRF